MAVLEIAQFGEEILRTHCKPVTRITPETRRLITDMIQTMRNAAGVGLAAPQVRVNARLFVYDIGEGPDAIINPEIVFHEGEVMGSEGCLSIPRLHGDVPRHHVIRVTGLNRHGKRVEIEARDFLARVFQHEMDHLDGILFIDRADIGSLHWITEEDEEERVEEGRKARGYKPSEPVG